MTTKMIDKEMLKEFRVAANEALVKLGKKFNLTLEVGKISYTATNFTAKVEANLKGSKSKAAQNYEYYAATLKLKPLGSVITLRGHQYVIIGFNPRKQRFPVQVERKSTGTKYNVPLAAAKK